MLKSIAGAVIGEVIGHRKGHGLLGAGIGLIATRIATRSLPGALLVGGAILAKTVYDRRKERRLTNSATSQLANTPSLPPANP
jgi:hypothetical protein